MEREILCESFSGVVGIGVAIDINNSYIYGLNVLGSKGWRLDSKTCSSRLFSREKSPQRPTYEYKRVTLFDMAEKVIDRKTSSYYNLALLAYAKEGWTTNHKSGLHGDILFLIREIR